MSVYVSKLCGFRMLSALWSKRAQVGRALVEQWIPTTVTIVLLLLVVGVATVLAAGSERIPNQVSAQLPLPTPTPTPSPVVAPVPPPASGFYYTVRPGDTLSRIAWRFGTFVAAIVQANGIINPNQIFYGQVFWIPSASSGPPPGPTGSTIYIVRRGDTLYAIARRYGTTCQALAALNGLHFPYTIYVGQRLVVSGSGAPGPTIPPSGRVHIVRRGDTLYSIALRYGSTPQLIAAANGLWNPNLIYIGQRLVIP